MDVAGVIGFAVLVVVLLFCAACALRAIADDAGNDVDSDIR